MEDQEEVWVDLLIEGEPSVYQVSSHSRLRSWHRGRFTYRKFFISKTGYYHVTLKRKGVNFKFSLHRLVAMSFIPNPNNYPFVNHKDSNRLNNKISNLEWCTPKQNSQHAWAAGRFTKKYGVKNHRSRAVGYMFAGILLKTYGYLLEAENDGFESTCIVKAIKRGGTHKGFNWKYL